MAACSKLWSKWAKTAMKLIDLSQPLFDGAPNCPAHPPVRIERLSDHPRDGWRVESFSAASHTGSHVDAPLHRLKDGNPIDAIPLASFAGPAFIADLRGSLADAPITSRSLEPSLPHPLADTIVLLATGWGQRRAKTEEWLYHSPYLAPDGAQWLVDRKVRGVGIDHYSIGGSRDPVNARTHDILLGAGIWIVEELCFPPEIFALPQPLEFWSLPINLAGHSGAFCRPVVRVSQ